MAKIRINGDSSGYVEIAAPNAANNNTLEIGSGTKILTNHNLNVGNVGIGTDNPGALLHIKGTTGKLIVEDTNGAAFIETKNVGTNSSDDGVGLFKFINNGYTGASGLQARTSSNGSNLELLFMSGQFAESMRITSTGHTLPGADATQDLGSATKRWANIYSADLQLSNEGASNDVDGTWGKYTIQEGEDDLFLINRRSGKKYKFILQEVN